ncbi:ATP-binding protein [Dactylosporangium matsuzakiense]|uniref:ATP-binding protein n=1 Tax=Dactylosporangium matsuzakiense TaxID=53360 RepID=A0A9W6KMR0_9ACTN|nr:ATP-binding protein [Dactylosporangium matsuzakiense]UWZ48732.1 AAA family ATPase [Dactylosporangium matsuzakiense]GLL03111.1 ATP-binding protein [Dactylosporangium matsuzakiense]
MSAVAVERPVARRDLAAELRYDRDVVLVVAGIPGAGKTTLLRRLFPDGGDGVRVLDSDHTRTWWRRYLGRLPYRYWRPVVHLTHYARLVRAMRTPGPIVVHECATRPWARRLIFRAARRPVHLLLLDVSPAEALAGQVARNRRVRPSAFATHCRNWQQVLRRPHPQAATVTVMDRAQAARLEAIRFGGC